MDTAHYGGPSPWPSSVDRSTADRFMATADHGRCPAIWRAWQVFHMDSRGWQDIAYSSGVCPHGHRYEGRGPDIRTAAQGTTDGNNRSHATVYIAGGNDPLTDAAKRAFLDEGRRLLGLKRGHRDWKPTACPGEAVYAWRTAGFPSPSTGGFLMALSDKQQKQIYDQIVGGSDPIKTHVRELVIGGLGRGNSNTSTGSLPDDMVSLPELRRAIARVELRAQALQRDLGTVAPDIDVDEAKIAALVLAGLDPQAFAAAIADAMPAADAQAFLDALATRLQA